MSEQGPIIAFLSRPETYGISGPVERIDTHASIVFLAGSSAYKLKRAVKLPYLDFSTRERRIAACHREFALNVVAAPMLYRHVIPIVQRAGGDLAFSGEGETVDAVIQMTRFDQASLLDHVAESGRLSTSIAEALADEIARYHDRAPLAAGSAGYAPLAHVAALNRAAFQTTRVFSAAEVDALDSLTRDRLKTFSTTLDARAAAGRVRRGHGDLHLRNICLMDGRPVLYDCLDFSEELATIDVLYDLAFLLMDLWRIGLRHAANLIANQYCDLNGDEGYPLLPVFMAMRATVRAHVQATAAEQRNDPSLLGESRTYFDLALQLLKLQAPVLVAIGGYSGSGKTTIAERLAPELEPAPGARIVETDRLRKAMHGVAPDTRLPPAAYAPAISAQVYRTLSERAHALVRQGASVVATAVFDREDTRRDIEGGAADVPFTGVWLKVSEAVLQQRLLTREPGASDATAEVLARQLSLPLGPMGWCILDSGASGPEETTAAVRRLVDERMRRAGGDPRAL